MHHALSSLFLSIVHRWVEKLPDRLHRIVMSRSYVRGMAQHKEKASQWYETVNWIAAELKKRTCAIRGSVANEVDSGRRDATCEHVSIEFTEGHRDWTFAGWYWKKITRKWNAIFFSFFFFSSRRRQWCNT